MRRRQRKSSVRKKATRKKATRRQAPRTARRRVRARGGEYGAGPQSGGMIPAPPAAFIILIVVGLLLMLFITANKGALPGLEGKLPLDLVPKVVAGLFGKHGIADGEGNRVPISIDPRTYLKGLLGSGSDADDEVIVDPLEDGPYDVSHAD
jgi:hypothetical protein